jgi:hypothetical protein
MIRERVAELIPRLPSVQGHLRAATYYAETIVGLRG